MSVFCQQRHRFTSRGGVEKETGTTESRNKTRRVSVRLHGDVGGHGPQLGAVISAGSHAVGQLGRGGGACVGAGQSGLADLVLSLVEEDVGGAGLEDRVTVSTAPPAGGLLTR